MNNYFHPIHLLLVLAAFWLGFVVQRQLRIRHRFKSPLRVFGDRFMLWCHDRLFPECPWVQDDRENEGWVDA